MHCLPIRLAAIEERFGQLAACSADDLVVVAFSGHGTETHELEDYGLCGNNPSPCLNNAPSEVKESALRSSFTERVYVD